jgi:hypothetical protein
MFDNYTLRARYYPIVILLFPVIILGIAYSYQFDTIMHLFASVGLVGAFTYLFSQVGRDQGKRKENELWNGWGGPPTTQILRLRDQRIDKYSKMRYHQRLHHLCPVSTVPDVNLEDTDPAVTDEVYKAWTKYLISQTRDQTKYPLLFKENTSYGFRRNLWGVKPFAIILTSVLILGNYFYWAIQTEKWNPMMFPNSVWYASLGLMILLLFWIFIVTKDWVKIPAFAYAERLCESVDAL